jgi:hypothetical protein
MSPNTTFPRSQLAGPVASFSGMGYNTTDSTSFWERGQSLTAKKKIDSQTCPNCGAALSTVPGHSNFCPSCGQENHDMNVPVSHLLTEVFETIFHFDSKSIRTLWALALKPGFLTSEFMSGRRARYVTPIRLYIFISFVFFLLLSFRSGHRDEPVETAAQRTSTVNLGITFYGITSNELQGLRESQIDSLMQVRNIQLTALNKYVVYQMARTQNGGDGDFIHLIIKTFSYMIFLLMPFFGFLIYVFHRKRARHYIGTLVFSLHFHSFAFFALSILLLLGRIPGLSPITLIAPIILASYLFLCLRSVYGGSRLSTLLKTMTIGALYIVAVAALFLLTVFASVIVY